ncbi:unnamed protein product [Durusdinium trenchii]|uniref:Uncharacterized protein n=1 Tax=Durusdinium trenchii TaxID=1381693 RepID=A0ABP0QXQ3_9DINO
MVVRLAPSERPEGQASLHARQLTKEAILSSNEENSTPTKQPLPGWHLAMAAPCQLGTDRAPWGSEVDQIQRAAFPYHRDLAEPIVGLVMAGGLKQTEKMQGSVTLEAATFLQFSEILHLMGRILDGASFEGHTVDGTPVEPGAAPVATFDQDRRTVFAAQPIGYGNSSHYRFIPFCNASWCAVNELRFRFQEEEDVTLRNGAILIDFPAATLVDEFSISIPYNTTDSVPDRWILQGSNDRVRRCVLSGAPSYQAMPDGTYAQMMGETKEGRTVYREASGRWDQKSIPEGAIIYWDQTTLSWWVSPRLQQGGYGAIRCVGDVTDPHLLSQASCVGWNGQFWDVAPNVSFECQGNEWIVLHNQSRSYPLPDVPSAPVRWFKVSRIGVNWELIIEDLPGLVGQLVTDPNDGYVAARVTEGGENKLKNLGRIEGSSNDRCSVALRVNLSFVESSDPGHAIDCKATAFGIGGWLWPDSVGEGKLWLTCANDTEFEADNWVQRYAEATADSSFSFTSDLGKSPDSHALKAQVARALELAVAPTLLAGVSLSGPTSYFVCPLGSNCSFSPELEVRVIKGETTCGCEAQVLTIETHGFYKACYCLAGALDSSSGACASDGDFSSFAGNVLGAGPEPGRLLAMSISLGVSWESSVTGFTTQMEVYRNMLEYATGLSFSTLSFPSVVKISNASAPTCGYNPSACDLVGEVFCTLGEHCVVSLNGTSMRTFNGLKLVHKSHSCETALAHPALAAFETLINPKEGCTRSDGYKATYRPVHHWDMGFSTRGASEVAEEPPGPGLYKLCWSYDPQANVSSTGEDFSIYRDAGYMTMLGPLAMDFECFLHFPCIINISGIGLAASNKVLLIEITSRCGDPNISALDDRWSTSNPTAVTQDSQGSFNLYSFGINAGKHGASHRICWAHDPEREGSLSDSTLYRVEIDPDLRWFRLSAVVDCVVLGRPCHITVMGSGILPSSKILLISNEGRCGATNATAVSIAGLSNPTAVESDTAVPSVEGLYALGALLVEALPLGVRICWGSNPKNGSAVDLEDYPFEVAYPMHYASTSFFEGRVGAIGLVQLDSEKADKHRVLALYSDPSDTPETSNTLVGSPTEWADYDCCSMAGHAAGAVLRVDATNRALPAGGYVFHQRPSDGYAAVALTMRRPLKQGLLDCESCDDFTSKHTDYVVVTGIQGT